MTTRDSARERELEDLEFRDPVVTWINNEHINIVVRRSDFDVHIRYVNTAEEFEEFDLIVVSEERSAAYRDGKAAGRREVLDAIQALAGVS